MQKIAIYIDEETKQQSEIYYSLENNSMGEAGLVCVEEIGEEFFPGTFLSERKKHGNTKAYRKGFTTTHKSKIAACAKLKYWVETDKLEVASNNLLRELKVFISRGNSYGAKEGENDDLVMALVLIIRMAQEVTNYEDAAYDYLMEEGLDSDYDDPMPMSFL
jgi:hypothetical protein